MEFNEKLQSLRKQKNLTQEELADALFVSRTAISKWESGRGYPNIDSLKAIAQFFSITIDELLSGDELLTIAEADNNQRQSRVRDMVFGLLDLSVALFFLLPLFGQRVNDIVQEVSLISISQISPYLKTSYFVLIIAMSLFGVATLVLQNWQQSFWSKNKNYISLALNVAGEVLFIISRQPNAAILLFVYLVIKTIMLVKKR